MNYGVLNLINCIVLYCIGNGMSNGISDKSPLPAVAAPWYGLVTRSDVTVGVRQQYMTVAVGRCRQRAQWRHQIIQVKKDMLNKGRLTNLGCV